MTDPRSPMPGSSASLIDRAKNILITPKTEWPRIDAEPATIQGIYTGYVMILAAIGPIALIIGQQAFGYAGYGVRYTPPIQMSLGAGVATYVLSLINVYILALVINALAPSFGGTQDQLKAFKIAAYSSTAAWLAGIFQIVPALAFLAIVGLYSLYLLFLGLPQLMRVAQDKAVGYIVVVIVVQVVLYLVVGMIVGALVYSFFAPQVPAITVRY